MAERRNKFRIIIDLLNLVYQKGKIRPTHLLYGGNLSYDRLKKYVSELEEKGLITEIKEKDKSYYIITEKGINFINEAKKLKELTDAFGL